MKGIVHFAVGTALASCFPAAVASAADGKALYMVLGGVFGLLPDTLDFKFHRYFVRHDVEVTPDPLSPDAAVIAESVAAAVHAAGSSADPVRMQLDTIRLGADRWRQYEIRFDIPRKSVIVEIGPEIDTGGHALTAAGLAGGRAVRALAYGIALDYEASIRIGAFDGPMLAFERRANGCVAPRFIPWHRQWSHSLAFAAAVGLLGWAAVDAMAGAIAGGAIAAHALTDHLGFMGSNLAYPFRRTRQEGLKRLHSDEVGPNWWTVWGSCLVVFWNAYRLAPPGLPELDPLRLLFYAGIVPYALSRLLTHRGFTFTRRSA